MNGLSVFMVFLAYIQLNYADDDPLCSGVPPGEVVLFPYPDDCTKYYECAEGVKTEKSCSSGLWFNNALQACDHPDHSGCIQSTTTPTDRTVHPFCTDNSVDYFPYPGNCARYYECYEGNLEVHTCPSGLWFNSAEKRCVYPEQSDCHESTPPTPYPTPGEGCIGVLPGQTILRPYPGDCNRYIECYGNQRTDMECPPHLYFSYEKQLCDWPSESGCDDSTASPDPSTTIGPNPPTTPGGDDDPRCANGATDYWPHPDCTKYIECYEGHGYTMDCPSGLYFNPNDKKCEDPATSECGVTPTDPIPTSTKDPDWTPDPDCPWPSSDRYLFPYPGDCTKFWECADGEKFLEDCPEDLYFNPTLLVCDYPYEAGCQWA